MAKLNELNYVTTNRFYVEMERLVTAAFSECSGLDVEIEKEVYQEGGLNNQQRIFLKQTKFGDITLKRGITDDPVFWDWIRQSVTAGNYRRRNINILVFNQAGETMQAWKLIGAVPVKWKTPSLNADSSTVALEELVLAYEGLTVFHKDSVDPKYRVDKSGGAEAGQTMMRDQKGYFPGSE
ncbi:phage tail protein [Phormidium sp. CLA17]|uniref:phage tail protein n=1 Tax=Leptolyngbya sp. Cla-17 TaxID=2803751 RepID=UPI001492049F|nr:phage tail protein [Leptolyngbya sp. Cla-17]MBM0744558.1 phage tail protein [Leptolyngbya sp. Cla-17]